MSTPSPLLRLLRHSGNISPSLLLNWKSDEFEAAVLKVVVNSPAGPVLRQDPLAVDGLIQVVKMANDKTANKKVLEQRRSIILAIVKATNSSNVTLKSIVSKGFLATVKSWLNNLLQYDIGGVDMLLHLLDSIYNIPVSKELVVLSGIGKAILMLERHKICISGRNEAAIKSRTSRLKEKWMLPSELTKQSHKMDSTTTSSTSNKRSSLSSLCDSAEARKVKKAKGASESRSKFSTASLLSTVNRKYKDSKKISTSDALRTSSNKASNVSAAEAARLKAQERIQKEKARLASQTPENNITIVTEEEESSSAQDVIDSQAGKTIRWADEMGLSISVPFKMQFNEEDKQQLSLQSDKQAGSMSWSDRRKRDVMREKEMMTNARNSIAQDDETELPATIPWRKPSALFPHPSLAAVQVISNEISKQASRTALVPLAVYNSTEEVPNNPKSPSDLDNALDTASMISTVTETIPFFSAPPTNVYNNSQYQLPNTTVSPEMYLNVPPFAAPAVMPPPASAQEASLEFVKAQGLPQFLVGSNVQALQTIVSTPGLIDSYSDNPNSLSNLVNTLTQNLSTPVASNSPNTNILGNLNAPLYPAPVAPLPSLSSPNQAPMHRQQYASNRMNGNGFRGDQNSEANLHLSGYGPTTTDADIRALFAPYVEVLEIAMKSGFSFVNTASTEGSRHAREALRGALLGGRPIRINSASKKAHEPDKKNLTNRSSDKTDNRSRLNASVGGQSDCDNIRDERGNPATKNLFVAGFGAGTTEKQLFDLFNQQVSVSGTILKGTFAFINTTDKAAAIKAREFLSGAVVNGGPMRINFAKESGRLGTSFDSTYGPSNTTVIRIGARI